MDPKGICTRNQFGFAIGGPILKNKLFIFESTEWTRVRSLASETQEILDPSFISMLPANVQAYFTSYGAGAVSPSGVVTTAGQLVAAGYTVGPINGTTAVASSQPIFDVVNFKVPFDAGGDVPQNTYSLVGRVDFDLTSKATMFFRAGRQSLNEFLGSTFYSAYPQYDSGSTAVNQSFLYSLSHIFTTNLFDNAKLSFTRFNDATSFNTALTNTPNLMITPPTDPVTNGDIQFARVAKQWRAGVRWASVRRSTEHNSIRGRSVLDKGQTLHAVWRPADLHTAERSVRRLWAQLSVTTTGLFTGWIASD